MRQQIIIAVVFLLIGFGIATLFSAKQSRSSGVDLTSQKELMQNYPWIENAEMYSTPRISVILPTTGESELIAIFDAKTYPIVVLSSDEVSSSITLSDKDKRTLLVSDLDNDGKFNALAYKGVDTEGAVQTLVDRNVSDGLFFEEAKSP